MAKREHGYIALVPVFIPVPKNDLPNQIAAATALHEATRSGSLDQIMGLPGVRLHVKPGKDIVNRWTSVQVAEADEAEPEQTYFEKTGELEPGTLGGAEIAGMDELPDSDIPSESPAADPETTTGRRRRAAA